MFEVLRSSPEQNGKQEALLKKAQEKSGQRGRSTAKRMFELLRRRLEQNGKQKALLKKAQEKSGHDGCKMGLSESLRGSLDKKGEVCRSVEEKGFFNR